MQSPPAERFVADLERMIRGEDIDPYESMVCAAFEYLAGSLFESARSPGIWYDGVDLEYYRKRKKTQVEFKGEIWVAKGQQDQWKEPFYAIVTDKRGTKQGVTIYMKIGEFEAEGLVDEHL